MGAFHLAQLNIARARGPMTEPVMADFVARLDEINQLAERSPGYVWRFQTEIGNATNFQPTDDPLVILNLTVWEDADALHAFTYRSEHRTVFAHRFEWFERWTGPSVVLWWQPADERPSVDEALRRLGLLAAHGPTTEAFTFKQRFPAPA